VSSEEIANHVGKTGAFAAAILKAINEANIDIDCDEFLNELYLKIRKSTSMVTARGWVNWTLTLIHHLAVDFVRSEIRYRNRFLPIDFPEQLEGTQDESDYELWDLLDRALKVLETDFPSLHNDLLAITPGVSREEAAQELGRSEQQIKYYRETVRKIGARIRDRLEKEIQED
jgi:DNA-directed RNA polymerase specialized sigma24 family protein